MTPELLYAMYMRHGEPIDRHAHHRHEALALARARRRRSRTTGLRRRWFGVSRGPAGARVAGAA